jgi:biotin operon repressor
MIDTDITERIHSHLKLFGLGRIKAIQAAVLAEAFGMSLRQVNAVIEDLRKSGVMIGSAKVFPCGYYIPANSEEVKAYIHTYRSEMLAMLKTFNIQRRAQRSFIENINQQQLFPAEFNDAGQMELVLTR